MINGFLPRFYIKILPKIQLKNLDDFGEFEEGNALEGEGEVINKLIIF